MKVMISQPMNGRSEEEIKKEREEIIKKLSIMLAGNFDNAIKRLSF